MSAGEPSRIVAQVYPERRTYWGGPVCHVNALKLGVFVQEAQTIDLANELRYGGLTLARGAFKHEAHHSLHERHVQEIGRCQTGMSVGIRLRPLMFFVELPKVRVEFARNVRPANTRRTIPVTIVPTRGA